jgi:hypothetical protein
MSARVVSGCVGTGGDGPVGGDVVVFDDQEFGDQVDGGAGVVGDDRDGLACSFGAHPPAFQAVRDLR